VTSSKFGAGGKNLTTQAHRGLMDFYNSAYVFEKNPYPFSAFHGVDLPTARKIQQRELNPFELPSSTNFWEDRLLVGGRGSAKTTWALFTCLALSTFYPDNYGIMVRKRWDELKAYLVDELLRLTDKVTDGNAAVLLDGPKQVGSTWEFIVRTTGKPSTIQIKQEPDLDDVAIENTFKGKEYGWHYLDELVQLREITYSTLQDSTRRQTVPINAGIACTNPPIEGMWVYKKIREQQLLEGHGEDPYLMILRSSTYDNPFLPPNYIKKLERKYKNDPVKRAMLLLGQDGADIKGKPVYGTDFDPDIHLDSDLRLNPYRPIYVGMDFGYHHPAAIFAQVDEYSRLIILGEYFPEDISAKEFGLGTLDYIKRKFPRHKHDVIYYGDPAGQQASDKGPSTFKILASLGIDVGSIPHRRVEDGIDLIRGLLAELSGTPPKARLRIHQRQCPVLSNTLAYGYHYKITRDGRIQAKPNKDGYWEHLADAVRYLGENLFGAYGKSDWDSSTRKGGDMLIAAGPPRIILPD